MTYENGTCHTQKTGNFMNLLTKIIFSTSIMSATSLSFAAPTDELKVIGKITPSACSPSFRETTVDFGTILATNLYQSDSGQIPMQSNYFQVNCDSPTKFSIEATDNKPETVITDGQIGLDAFFGLGSGGLGAYKLYCHYCSISAETDGASQVTVLTSKDSGSTWLYGSDGFFYPSATNRVGFSLGGVVPEAFKFVGIEIAIHPTIISTNRLDLSSPIAMDGSFTFTLHYE